MVNAPTANTIAAAEHGIALIAALSRNVAQADASMKKGEWKRSTYTGVSLVGKTLSIMGFGKVCGTPTAFIYGPLTDVEPGQPELRWCSVLTRACTTVSGS